MATICLLSAKGSPGVTTTAVALAMAWAGAHPGRSAIAIDADPIGGDTAAGVLRGALTQPAGMIPIAFARSADPIDAVNSAAVDLRPDRTARLLPGVPDEARSAALELAWVVVSAAASSLEASNCDLIVDAGRLRREGLSAPWIADSDLAILVVRPTLPAVTAAHRLAQSWPLRRVPLHLAVIGAPSPYKPDCVANAVGLPLLGEVAFDPASACVHSEGAAPGRGFPRSAYVRSIGRLAGEAWACAGGAAPLGIVEESHGRA